MDAKDADVKRIANYTAAIDAAKEQANQLRSRMQQLTNDGRRLTEQNGALWHDVHQAQEVVYCANRALEVSRPLLTSKGINMCFTESGRGNARSHRLPESFANTHGGT
jgi:predicted  nucleic acid-binding Zn-ribbon protein